jgi:hypothetical protein
LPSLPDMRDGAAFEAPPGFGFVPKAAVAIIKLHDVSVAAMGATISAGQLANRTYVVAPEKRSTEYLRASSSPR